MTNNKNINNKFCVRCGKEMSILQNWQDPTSGHEDVEFKGEYMYCENCEAVEDIEYISNEALLM